MRVISGHLRGRKLKAVRGLATRPTADRVREALFNIIGSQPEEAVVLDLFAGTGALGIEALSRGASRAVFIDHAPGALAVLNENLAACALVSRSQVIRWDILKNLNCLSAYPQTFDLIFMDPPYNRQMIQPALTHLLKSAALAPVALVVVEHDPREAIAPPAMDWACCDYRRYGQTALSFFANRASPRDLSRIIF